MGILAPSITSSHNSLGRESHMPTCPRLRSLEQECHPLRGRGPWPGGAHPPHPCQGRRFRPFLQTPRLAGLFCGSLSHPPSHSCTCFGRPDRLQISVALGLLRGQFTTAAGRAPQMHICDPMVCHVAKRSHSCVRPWDGFETRYQEGWLLV